MQKGYGEFADDIILLTWSREVAMWSWQVPQLGLTVSFTNTKFIAIGSVVYKNDQQPLVVGDGMIECHFLYLASVIMNQNRYTN